MGIVYTWTFYIEDYVPLWLANQSPTGTLDYPNANISVDVIDDYSGVDLSLLDAYVNGDLAFSGPNTFYSPYDGSFSSISPTTVDGYDGYHLVLDKTSNFNFGSSHDVRITASDNYGNTLDDTFSFNVRDSVKIIDVRPGQYEIVLIVSFDGYLTDNDNLRNVSNYQFTNGMYARYVEAPILYDGYARDVTLWVEKFYGYDTFEIEVSNLTDQYGFIIEDSSYTFSPFKSSADLTNYNGLVRTWHESNFVIADSRRVYLAGTAGIDCFRKIAQNEVVTWGQIFDSYGVESMFLLRHGADYRFIDDDPPVLIFQNPTPGYWDGVGNISFIAADIETAIAIVDVFIEINRVTVFDGQNGGFQNDYSGSITLGYKSVAASIKPPSEYVSGSIVTVHLIISDLMGNTLDTSYQYIIGISGFGIGGFGVMVFGS